MQILHLGSVRDQVPAGPSLRTGRYLYVGLGAFGRQVLQKLKSSLPPTGGDLPPLTQAIVVDESAISGDLPGDPERLAIHRAFLQPAVANALRDRFHEGLEQCAAMLPMGEMPADTSDTIRVFVVADLAEAFGSAIVVEVARALHDSAGSRPHTVTGLLRFCPKPSQRARAFAVFRELAAELRREGSRSSGLGAQSLAPCFDRCFLVGKSNRKGDLDEVQQTALLARLLAQFLRGGLPGIEVAVADLTPDERSRLASAGLSSAYFPRRAIERDCVRRWCEEVCKLLTAIPPETTGAQSGCEPSLQLDTVNDVSRLLHEQLNAQHLRLPDSPLSGNTVWTRTAFAESLQDTWLKTQQSCKEAWSKVDKSLPLRKSRNALVAGVRRLVETRVGGIARTRQQFERVGVEWRARIAEAEARHHLACDAAANEIAALEEQLTSAATNSEGDPSLEPVPPWYFLFRRWRRWLAIRRARTTLMTWHAEVMVHLRECTRLILDRVNAEAVLQAYRDFGKAAGAERDRVRHLLQELASVPALIQQRQQTEESSALVVDRSILSTESYDEFYRRFVGHYRCEVTAETISQLLETEVLLSDYGEKTAKELAERMLGAAVKKFRALGELSLPVLLEIAGLTPQHLTLAGWLSHDLWDYAEPLTKVNCLAADDQDRFLGEFAALQVPALESLASPPTPWPYGPNLPTVIGGSDCSVHLCRVQQGFTLSSIDELSVCREAYQAIADRRPLHIAENTDGLPEL